MTILKLNFTKHEEAQDMIRLIQKEKGFSVAEAIDFSINLDKFNQIIETGWASIALGLWGHDDFEREWLTLDNPCIDVDFSEEKINLIKKVAKQEKVDTETSVSYFLLFTMDELGYHI